MTKKLDMTCRHPDRDCPKLLCGHPLPCPWHTATIDLTHEPPTITIPITSQAAYANRGRLADIAAHLSECPPKKE